MLLSGTSPSLHGDLFLACVPAEEGQQRGDEESSLSLSAFSACLRPVISSITETKYLGVSARSFTIEIFRSIQTGEPSFLT
jgi:hypothetical protein